MSAFQRFGRFPPLLRSASGPHLRCDQLRIAAPPSPIFDLPSPPRRSRGLAPSLSLSLSLSLARSARHLRLRRRSASELPINASNRASAIVDLHPQRSRTSWLRARVNLKERSSMCQKLQTRLVDTDAVQTAGQELVRTALQRNPLVALAAAVVVPLIRLFRYRRSGQPASVRKMKVESYSYQPIGPVAARTVPEPYPKESEQPRPPVRRKPARSDLRRSAPDLRSPNSDLRRSSSNPRPLGSDLRRAPRAVRAPKGGVRHG